MDDVDDEMGHLYTGSSDTRCLARSVLEDWEAEHAEEENEKASAVPSRHLQMSREQFSTTHTARDPSKIDDIELENKDLHGMIRHPPKVGAVRYHHEPENTNTSQAVVIATTFQGTTLVITARASRY